MTGYTLGDSPAVFLARFEGSTGAQTWLSHLGEETGMPHRAQSVAVVEDSQYGFNLEGGGGAESTVPGSDAGGGTLAVDGEQASPGNDARIVVVGYNTSAASADSHFNTGFTAAADTSGNWAWFSASKKADRQTAIAIGGAGGRRQQQQRQQQQQQQQRQQQGGDGESFAYIVGTVATSEASPGNYLFLDIQRVVREASAATPAPAGGAAEQGRSPEVEADPAGGASSTTGLSQGSSLWLLIIAPILVVLSCIMMVSYVSKQCAIAFGTRPHQQHHEMDSIEFGAGTVGRGVRRTRSYRRDKAPPSDWSDDASPDNASADRRRRRDSGGGGSGGKGRGGRSSAWRSAFRNRDSEGPPYRKLGTSSGGDGRGRRGRRGSSASSSPPSLENDGEVELRQVTARHSPRGGGSPGNNGGSGQPTRGGVDGGGGGRGSYPGFEDFSPSGSGGATAASGWDAFEEEGNVAGAGGGEGGLSYLTGNPRDDEPDEGVLFNPNEPPTLDTLPDEGPQQFVQHLPRHA